MSASTRVYYFPRKVRKVPVVCKFGELHGGRREGSAAERSGRQEVHEARSGFCWQTIVDCCSIFLNVVVTFRSLESPVRRCRRHIRSCGPSRCQQCHHQEPHQLVATFDWLIECWFVDDLFMIWFFIPFIIIDAPPVRLHEVALTCKSAFNNKTSIYFHFRCWNKYLYFIMIPRNYFYFIS